MPTRSAVIASYNRAVRRARVSHFQDELSKTLIGVARATLEFFNIDPTESETEMPEPEEVREFIQQSLPPPSVLFGDAFMSAPLMPVMVLKDIGDLYGLGNPDAPFVLALRLETAEAVSNQLNAIVWLTWIANNSAPFTRSFLDRYKIFTDPSNVGNHQMHGGIPSTPPGQEQRQSMGGYPRGQDIPPENAPGSGPIPDETLQHGQDGTARHGSYQLEHRDGAINVSMPQLNERSEGNHFHDRHYRRDGDDNYNDHRKVGYIQQAFKDNRFTGELKQSIQITCKMYEITARQFGLNADKMADLFIHVLDGSARLFFIHNAKNGDSYGTIKTMMLTEYNSDARQLQVEGHLQQLRLRDVMAEESITDVRKGLTNLVNKIEELSPQCHPEFQTDRHKMNYLSDAVAEFSDWSLGPIENIHSQKFSFNRFVTALHESIQAKLKVKMLKNEASGGSSGTSGPTLINIGQYSRNPRHLRRDHGRKSKGHSPRTFEEARQMKLCFKCWDSWFRGHRCRPGSIRTNMRDRIKDGQSAVHLVSCLVDMLEFDESEEVLNEEGKPTHIVEGTQDALEEFDSYHADPTPGIVDEVSNEDEARDAAIATRQIASAMNPGLRDEYEQDFTQGGEEIGLNLGAQQ